jgi:hypothetical protein
MHNPDLKNQRVTLYAYRIEGNHQVLLTLDWHMEQKGLCLAFDFMTRQSLQGNDEWSFLDSYGNSS